MKKDRYAKIIEMLENNVVCSPSELAQELDCSEMTIRRDLASLEDLNLICRKHGCAFLAKTAQPSRFQTQIDKNHYEKEAIAKTAIRYFIRPHNVISLDAGTTTHTIAHFLPDNMQLSVITPNIYTALELSDLESVQTYLVGGIIYQKSKSVIIDSKLENNGASVDIAFMSARAFRIPGGAFEHTYPLIETKRFLVNNAKKVVLLIDHSKFQYNSLCNSIPLNKIDAIITDDKAPKDILQKAAELKKEVLVVNPETQTVSQYYNHR